MRTTSKGGTFSGGNRQILTICRSLLGDPRVIPIDEPPEGLAPMVVRHRTKLIQEIRRRGVSGLLVEHELTMALQIADKV